MSTREATLLSHVAGHPQQGKGVRSNTPDTRARRHSALAGPDGEVNLPAFAAIGRSLSTARPGRTRPA